PNQRVPRIDNLIKPRSQQVLLATVPTFVRSHAILARCLERTESQRSASDQFARNRQEACGFPAITTTHNQQQYLADHRRPDCSRTTNTRGEVDPSLRTREQPVLCTCELDP